MMSEYGKSEREHKIRMAAAACADETDMKCGTKIKMIWLRFYIKKDIKYHIRESEQRSSNNIKNADLAKVTPRCSYRVQLTNAS